MRQERPGVNMPLRLPLVRRLRIVDDSYKPVPVVPNIKNDVAFYRIGIFERSADLIKIVPANRASTTAVQAVISFAASG